MTIPSPLEEDEQAAFVQWLEMKHLKFNAMAASTWTTSWKQKAKNKAVGLRPGFPDLLILIPRQPPAFPVVSKPWTHRLVAIEMKKKNAPPSAVRDEQTAWIAALNAAGVKAVVCRGCAEAIEFIEGEMKK